LRLLRALDPGRRTTLSPRPSAHISFARLWAGFLLANTLVPWVALRVHAGSGFVRWAGVWYRKQSGRVRRGAPPGAC
jgi:hypothetical protein